MVLDTDTAERVVLDYMGAWTDTPSLSLKRGVEGEEREICQWAWRSPRMVELSIRPRADRIVVDTGDTTWECPLQEAVGAVQGVSIEPLPVGAITSVDRVIVEGTTRGSGDLSESATFGAWPGSFHLMAAIDAAPDSGLAIGFVILLCVLLGAALDVAIVGAASRLVPVPPVSLLAWLALPLQWVVIAVLRGVLALSPPAVVVGAVCLAIPRLVFFGFGASSRNGTANDWMRDRRGVAFVVSVLVGLPVFAWAAASSAFPVPGFSVFVGSTLAVWAIACVAWASHSGGPRWARWSCTAVALAALFLCLEFTVRATDELDRRLDVGFRSEVLTWPLEETTALFGRPEHRPDGLPWSEKPPGTYRVVCLGSSSTEGYGASTEDAKYPSQLERLLRARAGTDVDVINGGLGGAPLFMLAVYLEDVLLQLEPDVVLLYYGNNGESPWAQALYLRILDELNAAPHIDSEEEMWAALQLRWNPPWLVDAFLYGSRSRLVMALVLAVQQLDPDRDHEQGLNTRVADPAIIAATTTRIVDACRRQNVPLVLVPELCATGLPSGEGCHVAQTAYEAAMAARTGADVHLVSLSPHFAAQDRQRFFIDQVHMNDEGYSYLAVRIDGELARLGMPPAQVVP